MNYVKHLAVFLLILIACNSIKSQSNKFFRNDSIIVMNNGSDTLDNPWAGGMNWVQFSEIDLDIDGVKDLIVFDRTGNKLTTFVNLAVPNQSSYKHAHSYANLFPNIQDWVLLRDYNCDGQMDLFTANSGGIKVFINTTSSSTLTFSLKEVQLLSDYQPDSLNPSMLPVYVNSADIPAIADVDADGDLDILTFGPSGERLEYHKNLSMELYGNCDSLVYELGNRCWGYFKENLTGSALTLYDTCSFNVANPQRNMRLHAGSTVLTLDVDSSGSTDLVVGDAASQKLTLLINEDTTSTRIKSSINAIDTLFPSNYLSTSHVQLNDFPAAFYLDVNNDGVKDLLSAPNCDNGCDNLFSSWLFINNGSSEKPDFSFSSKSFLQNEMIEIGEGAYPVFFDYNEDGLEDIVVGNYGVYTPSASFNYASSLWLYENIGSSSNPVYQLVSSDYAGLSFINLNVFANQPTIRIVPAFGDLDGDGDNDMIVGDNFGYLHYFENTAGQGNPCNFVLNQAQFQGIDVGNAAAPALIDLDRDSLLDMVIGKQDGYLAFYKNTGTATSPVFSLITDSLGNVTTKRSNEFNGFSQPCIYDENGNYTIYSGSTSGYIYKYDNIEGNLGGTFSMDSSYLNIWEGIMTAVHVKKVNGDTLPELIVGNYAGGLAYYEGSLVNNIKDWTGSTSPIYVYPNPSTGKVIIQIDKLEGRGQVRVFSSTGRLVKQQIVNTNHIELNMNNFAKGLYVISYTDEINSYTQKLMLK